MQLRHIHKTSLLATRRINHTPPLMDLYNYIRPIEGLLALLLLLVFWRKRANKNKNSNQSRIPEPPGSWPIIGHLPLLAGKHVICKKLAALADQCGPLFSLKLGSHRLLVVSSWEVAKDCLTTNDKVLATRANIAVGRHIGYDNAIFALAPYGEYWRHIRKIATVELLSSHSLEKLKHIRFSEMDMLVKELFGACSKHPENRAGVGMSEVLEQLTFNINLRMLVGKRFSSSSYAQVNSEPWRYEKAIKDALYLSGIFVLADALPWLEWLDVQGHVRWMQKTSKELDSVIGGWLEEHIKRRRESPEGSTHESDFMDVLISNLPEDGEISGHSRDTIVKATTLILTMTGGESTSVTITWVLSLLLNHPNVLKQVQEELDINVGRDRWVQESDINNLKYLQAVVKETLRLFPPGPVTGIREAMEDCCIAGYHVPKGTRMMVNIWKLQRDPRMWDDVDEFKPERFMTTHAHLEVRGQSFEFMPFSSGRRSCPGITFGLQVVHLTVAKLLQGFDMRTLDGKPVDLREGLGLALPKLEPLEVSLAPRLSEELYKCL